MAEIEAKAQRRHQAHLGKEGCGGHILKELWTLLLETKW